MDFDNDLDDVLEFMDDDENNDDIDDDEVIVDNAFVKFIALLLFDPLVIKLCTVELSELICAIELPLDDINIFDDGAPFPS